MAPLGESCIIESYDAVKVALCYPSALSLDAVQLRGWLLICAMSAACVPVSG